MWRDENVGGLVEHVTCQVFRCLSIPFQPAALRTAQSAGYLNYSEADFEVFAPQRRHVEPMMVKFGMEEGTEGPLLHAKFRPHRCNVSPLWGRKTLKSASE